MNIYSIIVDTYNINVKHNTVPPKKFTPKILSPTCKISKNFIK
jgi:hypothetical protein